MWKAAHVILTELLNSRGISLNENLVSFFVYFQDFTRLTLQLAAYNHHLKILLELQLFWRR